jgi:hypothetical protein
MKAAIAGVILLTALASGVGAHEYPTIDRVEYVRVCMRDNPGPTHEMVYKCSCVIDAIAKDMSYEDYVDTSTAANAFTIGGQIGESVRDSETIKKMAARFREAQANAKKACFVR